MAQSCRNRSAGVIRLEIPNCTISSSANAARTFAPDQPRVSGGGSMVAAGGTQAEIRERLANMVRSLWSTGMADSELNRALSNIRIQSAVIIRQPR